jgi:hypothetical protein
MKTYSRLISAEDMEMKLGLMRMAISMQSLQFSGGLGSTHLITSPLPHTLLSLL